MASTRKRTHVSEAVQQLLAELRLTFTSPDHAHRKTATRIHGCPVSIPQRKQVNTRSVQAFKPVKDFCRIEGDNAVLSVVLARNTQVLEGVFICCADELSPSITVVGDEPLNFFRLLRRILMQTLLRLQLVSFGTSSIASP